MDRIKKEDYKSLAVAYLLSSALLYLGISMPFVLVAVPFILVYAVARGGTAAGGAAAVLSFAAVAYFDFNAALMLAAAFLPAAFTAGHMIRTKKRFFDSVLYSAGAVFAGAVIVVAIPALTGGSFTDSIVGYAGGTLSSLQSNEINQLYQMVRYPDVLTGAITQEAVMATPAAEATETMLKILRDTLDLWLATIIGIYSLLFGLLSYTIPRAVLKKRIDLSPAPAFSDYALPKRFWLAFALSYFFIFAGDSLGWKWFDVLGVTVYNLYAFVFTVQALSFMDYMYKKRNMGTGSRALLHVLSTVVLSFLLMWIGIMENVFGMRKRMDMGSPQSP